MDPNETLKRWAIAVIEEDRDAANEAYFALRAWIERGGFEPSWGAGLPSRRQFFVEYSPATGMLA